MNIELTKKKKRIFERNSFSFYLFLDVYHLLSIDFIFYLFINLKQKFDSSIRFDSHQSY